MAVYSANEIRTFFIGHITANEEHMKLIAKSYDEEQMEIDQDEETMEIDQDEETIKIDPDEDHFQERRNR